MTLRDGVAHTRSRSCVPAGRARHGFFAGAVPARGEVGKREPLPVARDPDRPPINSVSCANRPAQPVQPLARVMEPST